MKHIAILGSTGSIGKNTLQVARHLKESIKIVAIAAKENIDLLEAQAKEFAPDIIAVFNVEKARELQKRLPGQAVLGGMEGLLAVSSYSKATFVVSAMTGTLGLQPTIEAIKAGKDVGLANKEALVSGGAIITKLVKEKNINLLPIDSEHSAIFQCLQGEPRKSVQRIILTSSGGPFRTWKKEQLDLVTVDQALNHPTWRMGPKVTIDSSTLMNKGLEVIEAFWLFDLQPEQIDVVVHPQSIIHSLVEFCDSSMLAQMGEPNMIVPIQYSLTYPERSPGLFKPFDFIKNSKLEFFEPDKKTFRCLSLAYEALKSGGTLPCYMNAANEILVERFLKGEISWKAIGIQLEELMNQHQVVPVDSLETILAVDALAREEAARSELILSR